VELKNYPATVNVILEKYSVASELKAGLYMNVVEGGIGLI
jgi:hypothetical protein